MPTLVAVLALGAGAFLWRLDEGRGSAAPPGPTPLAPAAAPAPSARPPELAPVAAGRQEFAPTQAEPRLHPPKPCRLAVLVLWPTGGADGALAVAPDSVASVRLRHASGAFDTLLEVTPERPRAEIPCPPGEIELTLARHGPHALGALPVRAVLTADSDRIATLALVPLATLTGTLADARGVPLADVPLWLEHRGRPLAEARTATDGSFAFEPLATGSYELVLGNLSGPLVPRRALDLARLTGPLALATPELLTLAVHVLDERGEPVAGARVEGGGESGGWVSGETDAGGTLRARLLPAGTYRLDVRHPLAGRARLSFELPPEGRDPLEVRLRTQPAGG